MSEPEDSATVHPLVTRKSDAELAREFRNRVLGATQEMIELLDDAKKNGLRLSWMISPPDSFGRHHLVSIDILKEL